MWFLWDLTTAGTGQDKDRLGQKTPVNRSDSWSQVTAAEPWLPDASNPQPGGRLPLLRCGELGIPIFLATLLSSV